MKPYRDDDGVPEVSNPMKPKYANIFKIGITRSDIGIEFGNTSARGAQWRCYVQIPVAVAKVLGAMLTLAVAEYEKVYGPVPDISKDMMEEGKKDPFEFKMKPGVM